MLGTLTLITGRDMRGDRLLPDWLEQGAEPSLRDAEDDVPASAPAPTALGNYATPRAMAAAAASGPVVLTPVTSGGPSPVGACRRRERGRI